MNKVLLGIVLGAVLGVFDGLTAWFTPEVRNDIIGIVIGSTMKGVIAGIAAGWFATRVRNVAAGVAFGLVVGLILAGLVAYLGGGKYYFEIMLPGGTVGAIIGWATQRYGKPSLRHSSAAASLAMLMLLFVPIDAHAEVKAADAFAKLKALAGQWDGHILTPDGPPGTMIYRVSSGGSSVQQTLFPGTDYEMITMFTLSGGDLIAQHYCSGNNQPRMKLNAAKSTADELVFDFVSVEGDNQKGHIHSASIGLGDGKRLESWSAMGTEQPKKFFMARTK